VDGCLIYHSALNQHKVVLVGDYLSLWRVHFDLTGQKYFGGNWGVMAIIAAYSDENISPPAFSGMPQKISILTYKTTTFYEKNNSTNFFCRYRFTGGNFFNELHAAHNGGI
jgi:hypothetical protein